MFALLILACIIFIIIYVSGLKRKKYNNKKIRIIKSAFSSLESAHDFAKKFCELKVIACANIYKSDSVFTWHGGVQKTDEYIVEAKTHPFLKDKVINNLRDYHQYKIPQIIWNEAFCTQEYYNWLCGALNLQETKNNKKTKKQNKEMKTVSQDTQDQNKK